MFLADFLVRKEGEARVVDQQQVVREHLEHWLKTRPSAADVAERGILGRGLRFAFARDAVDKFLRAKAQAHAAELARIPPGDFEYTDRVHELLNDVGGESTRGASGARPRIALEEQLSSVRGDRELAKQRLEEAGATWSQAASACRQAICTGVLDSAAGTARSALQLLEAHRTSTGQSLTEIFADLQAFQRLAARKSCLESIIKVVDKTDQVRKAVFACRGADSVPLEMLEEIPVLCESLPSRSKAIGARRVQFLIGPLRDMLWQESQEVLKQTCQWPVDPSIPGQDDTAKVVALFRVCADLHRTQMVNDALCIPRSAVSDSTLASDDVEGSWVCSALASPLIARFRYHFWRPESELCKMDKPEWAFKYLLDISKEYGARISTWASSVLYAGENANDNGRASEVPNAALKTEQASAMMQLDLPAGLTLSMACEARMFIRARMPILAKVEARSLLLHTLERLIRFRRDVGEVGGSAAQAALFADFDSNRPVEAPRTDAVRAGKESTAPGESKEDIAPAGEELAPEKPPVGDGGFMGGLSHLRKSEAPVAAEADGFMGGLSHLKNAETPPTENSGGFMGGLSHLKKSEPPATQADGGFIGGLSHLKKAEAAAPPSDGGGFMSGLSHLRKADVAADGVSDRSGAPEDKSVHGQIGKVGANLMAGLSRFGSRAAAGQTQVVGAVQAGLSGGDQLLTGLSTFADSIADEAVDFIDAEEKEISPERPIGFLDVWAAADSEFMNEKLAVELIAGGGGWRKRPLNPREMGTEVAVEEPEVAELVTLFKGMFDKACSRAQCLTSEESRKLYSMKVLDAGLQRTVTAIRERWNDSKDPVKESRSAALLVETLQDICLFLDSFSLSKHLDASVDEANALRLGMIDKLADGLVDMVRPELRRLQSDACVFSYSLGPPLSVFVKRLRPSLFQKIARKCLASLADLLLKHLLRHPSFSDPDDMAQFVANCKEDLGAVLMPLIDSSDLRVVQPLWDGCTLLALSDSRAADLLASLRHVARCSPSHALGSLDPGEDPEDSENLLEPGLEVPVVGEVLAQRRADVFAKAGITDLPVSDAIAVLSKRPDLAGAMSDMQEAIPFGMMQDLLQGPVPGVAQATFQLGVGAFQQGVGALQQLQGPLPTNAAAAAAASAATATKAAAAELKSLLPGRLIGQVRSTLGSTVS